MASRRWWLAAVLLPLVALFATPLFEGVESPPTTAVRLALPQQPGLSTSASTSTTTPEGPWFGLGRHLGYGEEIAAATDGTTVAVAIHGRMVDVLRSQNGVDWTGSDLGPGIGPSTAERPMVGVGNGWVAVVMKGPGRADDVRVQLDQSPTVRSIEAPGPVAALSSGGAAPLVVTTDSPAQRIFQLDGDDWREVPIDAPGPISTILSDDRSTIAYGGRGGRAAAWRLADRTGFIPIQQDVPPNAGDVLGVATSTDVTAILTADGVFTSEEDGRFTRISADRFEAGSSVAWIDGHVTVADPRGNVVLGPELGASEDMRGPLVLASGEEGFGLVGPQTADPVGGNRILVRARGAPSIETAPLLPRTPTWVELAAVDAQSLEPIRHVGSVTGGPIALLPAGLFSVGSDGRLERASSSTGGLVALARRSTGATIGIAPNRVVAAIDDGRSDPVFLPVTPVAIDEQLEVAVARGEQMQAWVQDDPTGSPGSWRRVDAPAGDLVAAVAAGDGLVATIETDAGTRSLFSDDGTNWQEVPGRLSSGPSGVPFLIDEPDSITLVSEWPRTRKIIVPGDVGEPRQVEIEGDQIRMMTPSHVLIGNGSTWRRVPIDSRHGVGYPWVTMLPGDPLRIVASDPTSVVVLQLDPPVLGNT